MSVDAVVSWSGRGWSLSLYPLAGEAGGAWVNGAESSGPPRGGDPERSRLEAARRARGQVRRYCTANGLNRLGTLTYAGAGNHDPVLLREHLGVFFRSLRSTLGGEAFPYLWVPEWHKTGHGLHAHFGVGQFVPRGRIVEAWGHGFVHITMITDLPVGSGRLAESRKAAAYLAKYVGKAFAEETRVAGLHRYEVAEGFQPEAVKVQGETMAAVLAEASEIMGRRPSYVWRSGEVEGWKAPPAVWASWE